MGIGGNGWRGCIVGEELRAVVGVEAVEAVGRRWRGGEGLLLLLCGEFLTLLCCIAEAVAIGSRVGRPLDAGTLLGCGDG